MLNKKTGRKASAEAEHYLSSSLTVGEEKQDSFIEECNKDGYRFEINIKRTFIVNFATESFTKKNKSRKAKEIAEAKGTRNLYACLLSITEKHLQLKNVLSFPLTPIPAEFTHPDGTFCTTTKTSVVDLFEVEKSGPATLTDTVIIDGMFFLQHLWSRQLYPDQGS